MLESLILRPLDSFIGEAGVKVLREMAEMVHLPRLKSLTLQGFHGNGSDLWAFLQNNSTLRTLELENVNILGDIKFADILRRIATELNLRSFSSRCIAQGGLRIRRPEREFESVEIVESKVGACLMEIRTQGCWFDRVAEGEFFRERLRQLADSLDVSDEH